MKRPVPDIVNVLSDVLARLRDRRAWELRGEVVQDFSWSHRRSGFIYLTPSRAIHIWRRPDGSWGGWMGLCGACPVVIDAGFTLTCASVRPECMDETQAKQAALHTLRESMIADAACLLLDSSVIDETQGKPQL